MELLLDYASKQTKGAGFVRYETVAAAADAVAALHGNYTFPGAFGAGLHRRICPATTPPGGRLLLGVCGALQCRCSAVP